ncbi:MAG: HAD family phosphatase [Candidatus Hydrogenedentes bacterium]|nr:HAD family phosphatase [Candidatus Hydrogenedentota bacterium]
MMDVKAFLFDLDGTLIDSEIVWVYAVRDYLKDRGIGIDDSSAIELVYGNPWDYIYEEIAKRYPSLSGEVPALIEKVHPYFDKYASQVDLVIPGSVEILKRLSEHYPCAIVSGSYKNDVIDTVRKLGLEKHLVFALGKEDYTPGKPHPAGYLKAAKILEVEPEKCVAFEDSTVGFKAVKSAGMFCVALARPGRPIQDTSFADLVLPDLSLFSISMLTNKSEYNSLIKEVYKK